MHYLVSPKKKLFFQVFSGDNPNVYISNVYIFSSVCCNFGCHYVMRFVPPYFQCSKFGELAPHKYKCLKSFAAAQLISVNLDSRAPFGLASLLRTTESLTVVQKQVRDLHYFNEINKKV